MTRKKKLAILIPCGIVLLSIVLLTVLAVVIFRSGSTGWCLIADNGSVLWIDDSGSPVVMRDMTEEQGLFDGLESGDRIWLLHDGVNESYPGGTGVYVCIKTGDGTIADLPRETLDSLTELGWISGSDDNFSFSLTWNVYGVSSYDSETGRLVKTIDATEPEDYVTELTLSEERLGEIYEIVRALEIESYPDEYDPAEGMGSDPFYTIELSVRYNGVEKTVRCEEVAIGAEGADAKGRRFLEAVWSIRDILTATEEWQALPEYEVFYD